jgi:hypothetical protein
MAKAGGERIRGIPAPVNDPNIGNLLINLTMRIEGAVGTDFASDHLEIGLTFDKARGINRASFSTTRQSDFPENFIQTIQNKLPEILLSAAFGGMNDQQMPSGLENYDHTSV